MCRCVCALPGYAVDGGFIMVIGLRCTVATGRACAAAPWLPSYAVDNLLLLESSPMARQFLPVGAATL
jgi:hypothetical protein